MNLETEPRAGQTQMNGIPEARYVDGGEIAEIVEAEWNRDTLRYLLKERPSCHSDIGSTLIHAASACGEWLAFSPSFQRCRYVALVTNKRIFALGLGMRLACYRLSAEMEPIALQTGATAATEIGPCWVRFDLFRSNWPAPDLPFWTLRAYAAARGRDE